MKQQFFIGTAATLLCLYQLSNIDIAYANECTNLADGCLKINKELLRDILTFKVSDILPSNQTRLIVPSGNSLEASSTPTVNQKVSRRVDNLWELEVERGSENDLEVEYEYEKLTHSALNTSEIQLESVEKINPTFLRDGSTPDKVVVGGGAVFHFNLSNIKASGKYSGNLVIKVTPSTPIQELPRG